MSEEVPTFRKPDRYKESSYRTYNDRKVARYDSSPLLAYCQVPLWDRTILAEIGPGIGSLAILDVGCATGRLLDRMAEAGGRRLSGFDLAPRILEVAREKLEGRGVEPELRSGDAEEALPWPDASFDLVTMTGVLHHLTRPLDALEEVRRVLREDGRFLLDPSFFPPLRQLMNLALRLHPHEGDYRFYTARQAAGLLARAGFRCSDPRRVGLWGDLIRAERLEGRDPSL